MTIIGICGFQSAGKDTLAEYLINTYGFVKISYAGALKDVVSIIFGWDRQQLEGITSEDRLWREQVDQWWATELNMPQLTPRYVLQYFGTDLFRKHWHGDIWVKVIENKLNKMYKYKNIVITDCRFKNEIDLLKKYNGILINIYRGELPSWFEKYKNGEETEETKKMHISETDWIRCQMDYTFNNDGTKEQLFQKFESIKYKI